MSDGREHERLVMLNYWFDLLQGEFSWQGEQVQLDIIHDLGQLVRKWQDGKEEIVGKEEEKHG